MKKQIVFIAPRQTAKVIAILWIAFTLPFVAAMALALFASGAPNRPNPASLLIFPLLYGVFGYLFTLIGAWLYNQVARRFGGIEYETSEMSAAQPGAPADGSRPTGSARG